MTTQPYNVAALVANLTLVCKTGDIDKLNGPTYQFIITHMGFIAHYNIHGFRQHYQNVRRFRLKLQSSEMSQDLDWNLDHARQLEQRRDEANRVYILSVAAAITQLVEVARNGPFPPPAQLPLLTQPRVGEQILEEFTLRVDQIVSELHGLTGSLANDEANYPDNPAELSQLGWQLTSVETAIDDLTTVFWQQLG